MASSVRSAYRWGFWSVCVVLVVASAAWGDMITVQVTGVVTASDFSSIGTGSAVRGFYTYDDALTPTLPNPNLAWYMPVTGGLTFVGGSSLSSDVGGISVNNNSSGLGAVDTYGMEIAVIPDGGAWSGAFAETAWDELRAGIRRHDPTGDGMGRHRPAGS